MQLRNTLRRAISIAALALIVAQGSHVKAAEHGAAMADDDMATMIENAKTPADHERIAAMYDQQAADAKKQAEVHRRMEKSYSVGSGTGKGTPTPLPQHCAALAKHYDEVAQEDATLAAAHREMAKAAAKK
jgi:hypothetical protein